MDTLRLKDGKFEFTTPLTGTATYYILYPNFSELTIFGEEGKEVKVKGDARSLNEVEVKGTKENEIYTRFRMESLERSGRALDTLVRDYILRYPTFQMSKYLLTTFFILPENSDPSLMWESYDSLCRANPGDIVLSNLSNDIRSKNVLEKGKRIPSFKFTTRRVELKEYKKNKVESRFIEPTEITDTSYIEKPLLMIFWASWRSGSASGLFRARKALREFDGKLQPISYSLDVENRELKSVEQRDTIDYPSYCDFRCWSSPLVQQWGIRELPYFILLDKDRKIVAKGTNWAKDIEPHIKTLCS